VNGIARQSAHDVMSPSSGVVARNRTLALGLSFDLSFLPVHFYHPIPPNSPSMIFPFFFFILSFLSTRLSPSFYVVVTFADPFYQYQTTH
jgi:hypothetical protein